MLASQLICNKLNCNFPTTSQKKHSILCVALLVISLSGLVFFLFLHEPSYSFLGTKIIIGILSASIPTLMISSLLLFPNKLQKHLLEQARVPESPRLEPMELPSCETPPFSMCFEEWEPSLHPLDTQIFEEPEVPIINEINFFLEQQYGDKILINQYVSLIHHPIDKNIFYAVCYRNQDGFFTKVFTIKDNAKSFIIFLRKVRFTTTFEEGDRKKIKSFSKLTLKKRDWIVGKSPSTECLLPKKSYWPASDDGFWWVMTHHKSHYIEVRYYSSVQSRDRYIELLKGYQNSYIAWREKLKRFD